MANVKVDLYGSTYVRGFSHSIFDRGYRRCRVWGMDGLGPDGTTPTPNQMDEAIQEAAAVAGDSFHHIDGSLPLAYAKARRIGPDAMDVELYYGRRDLNFGGTQPQSLVARFRTGVDIAEWYLADTDLEGDPAFDFWGMPDGYINGLVTSDGDGTYSPDYYSVPPGHGLEFEPKKRLLNINTMTIQVPVELSQDPGFIVLPYLRRVNSGAVLYGSYLFQPGELLFLGYTSDVRSTQSGVVTYDVVYSFKARFGGFRYQVANWGDGDNEWSVDNVDLYPALDFALSFPG